MPICAPTVLFAPPVADPVAKELTDTVPNGKPDPGISPAGTFARLALAPAKPPTALLAPPVTAPAAVDGSIVPKFTPTKPPTKLFAPVPVTVALWTVVEFVMTPILRPTNPPSKLSNVPMTGPDALDELIAPEFAPMNPPTQLFAPVLLTDPDAVEFVIVVLMSVTPISPPRMLLPPPLTAPVA